MLPELHIGAGGGANNLFEVSYLQVIGYKGTVTDGPLIGIETHLQSTYGLGR